MGKRDKRALGEHAEKLALKAQTIELGLRKRPTLRRLDGNGGLSRRFLICRFAVASRGRKLRERLEHIFLASAGTPGYLDGVVLREQGVFDGGEHRERRCERGGPALCAREVVRGKATIDTVLQKRLRVLDELLKLDGSVRGHVLGGVEVVGQGDGAQLDPRFTRLGRHRGVDELQRAVGRLLTCGVTVEEIDDLLLRMTTENADVAHGERRAERGHRVAHSPFVKRDDIGVSFAHDSDAARCHGDFRLIKAIEHLRLVEQRRLLGVEVFWLPLPDDAPAERDAVARHVVYGEHDAVVETIAQLALGVTAAYVRLDHFVGLKTFRRKMARELAAPRGEPEVPVMRDLPA